MVEFSLHRKFHLANQKCSKIFKDQTAHECTVSETLEMEHTRSTIRRNHRDNCGKEASIFGQDHA